MALRLFSLFLGGGVVGFIGLRLVLRFFFRLFFGFILRMVEIRHGDRLGDDVDAISYTHLTLPTNSYV